MLTSANPATEGILCQPNSQEDRWTKSSSESEDPNREQDWLDAAFDDVLEYSQEVVDGALERA